MQTVYLLALIGVAFAIVAALVDAIRSIHRKPDWQTMHPSARALLSVVQTAERRTLDMPFVGTDRRHPPDPGEAGEAERLRA